SQKLFLSLRYIAGFFVEFHLVTAWKSLDEMVCIGGFCGCDDFFVAGVKSAVPDIFHDGALEKPCILKNHTEETAEIAASHVTDIVAVNPDAAAVDIVKAHEKFYDGGFACTRRSNDGSRLSCADTGTEIVDDDFIIRVTEFYVVEFHIPAEF